jgi:hypothetical protein
MMVAELIKALSLPDSCLIDQRVPKKMLIENGAPTSGDKRLINEVIEEIRWIAVLKPNTIGVPDYRDEHREYREVVVLSIVTRSGSAVAEHGGIASPAGGVVTKSVNAARLAELMHRAVPYPVLLLITTPKGQFLSVAHKRWAQNEAGKVVLDGEVTTVDFTGDLRFTRAFMESLAVTSQPQGTLMTLYQGWQNCLAALLAAHYTGTFVALDDPKQAYARRTALCEYQRLEQESARIRAQAQKAKQMAVRVELNLALRRVEAALSAARKQL